MEGALVETLSALCCKTASSVSSLAVTKHVQEVEDGRWRYVRQEAVQKALEELSQDGSSAIMPVAKDSWTLMR